MQYLAAKELRPYKLVLEADHPLQAVHAERPRRRDPRHAGRDGRSGQQGVSPAARCRPEIRHRKEREEGSRSSCPTPRSANCCVSPDRNVRKTAFHQYYAQFTAHENTLAATLTGSIQKDVYYAKARGFKSALEAALFPDNVPQSRLRQPDRRGAQAPAGRASLLRRAPAEDEAEGHPSLRHLRADPQRPRSQATPGTRR